MVGERLVQVGRRAAPQFIEALLEGGLELRQGHAWHGRHNNRMDVRDFQLTRAPESFLDDPYPWYAALREQDPVHELEGGGVFLSRYDDALAVYRDSRASSDKKIEFKPKFGDSPLYEHHTTSLVFNDPPLHTRVRRLIMGALNQRAIARMEADVVALVDGLLERDAAEERSGSDRGLRRAHPGRGDRQPARHPARRARPAARLVDRHPLRPRAQADAGNAGAGQPGGDRFRRAS